MEIQVTEHSVKARALCMSYLLITKDMELAKQCAIVSVDEIISCWLIKGEQREVSLIEIDLRVENLRYWQEVKREIQSL